MPWKVNFYQNLRGESSVQEFILAQEKINISKITRYIDLLENNGPFLKPPYIKKIQDKLYELRISGQAEIRIFYTIRNGEYYLLHAFKKKTQQTPLKELKIALNRIRELT